MQFIWIWILVAFNEGGMDYEGNKFIFDNIDIIHKIDFGLSEWLNVYLASYLIHEGWEFFQYNMLLSSVSLCIIYYVGLKKCENINVFLSLFMMYPLAFMVIQKRYFWSVSFCILAFLFLEQGKTKKSLLSLILATGLHISAIFFLPYFLLAKKKVSAKFCILAMIIEFIVIMFCKDVMLSFIGNDSSMALEYTTTEMSAMGYAYFVGLQLCLITLMTKIIDKHKRKESFLYLLNIISLIYVPFLFLNSIFFRYYRAVTLYGYFYVADNIGGNKRQIIYLYVFTMAIAMILLMSFGKDGWDAYFSTLFTYNAFFNMF